MADTSSAILRSPRISLSSAIYLLRLHANRPSSSRWSDSSWVCNFPSRPLVYPELAQSLASSVVSLKISCARLFGLSFWRFAFGRFALQDSYDVRGKICFRPPIFEADSFRAA
jgi:hypothetical protein